VRVTVRVLAVAAASMLRTAVAIVEELMVKDVTVIPEPKLAVVVPCVQFVNLPVKVTERFSRPCWPFAGLTDTSCGVPAVTVKPFVSVSTSLPVVRVMVRAPVAAVPLILSTAVAVLVELTVNEATVIPPPKLAVVVPWVQLVNWPIRVTERFCCPCWPVFGVTETRAGAPEVTVKPLVRVSTWPPVVSVTLRAPVAALTLMLSTAVAVVAEVTVRDVTVMPTPKLAVVVPWTKFV
jgi:hypothetical protein